MKILAFFLSICFTSLFAFDISTASLKELTKIKGIGKKTAQRIIDYREENQLNSIDDLIKVKGIGKKRLAKIKHSLQDSEASSQTEESEIDLSKYNN